MSKEKIVVQGLKIVVEITYQRIFLNYYSYVEIEIEKDEADFITLIKGDKKKIHQLLINLLRNLLESLDAH